MTTRAFRSRDTEQGAGTGSPVTASALAVWGRVASGRGDLAQWMRRHAGAYEQAAGRAGRRRWRTATLPWSSNPRPCERSSWTGWLSEDRRPPVARSTLYELPPKSWTRVLGSQVGAART